MIPLDNFLITLQFQNKIYSYNGSNFQYFFENIMEKAYPDFQKIMPYGSMGDGGNDGYFRDMGVYYQVYAPNEPAKNVNATLRKLIDDFKKIKLKWDKIDNIKQFNFVFNDKYLGSNLEIENCLSQLKSENPNIEFKLFLPKQLEKILVNLTIPDLMKLGFVTDSTKANMIVRDLLEKVEEEIDKDNLGTAFNLIEDCKGAIFELNDQSCSLWYEILEGRCFQKSERVLDAIEKFKKISVNHSDDLFSLLYMAEIYLVMNNFGENEKYLKLAKKIDGNHWLLRIEELLRKNYLGEKIDVNAITEEDFTDIPRIKSIYYRLYALFLEEYGEKEKANQYIEEAIRLNPNRLNNYLSRLGILESRVFSNQFNVNQSEKVVELLKEIERLEEKFDKFRNVGARNRAILNLSKIRTLLCLENKRECEQLFRETFKLLLCCNLDRQVDHLLVDLLAHVSLPNDSFTKLLDFIGISACEASDRLKKELIIQFLLSDRLFEDGREYFKIKNDDEYLVFIDDLENRRYAEVMRFVGEDVRFQICLANTIRQYPELRKELIETLPDDKLIQKDKMMLLLNYDEENIEESFKILKELDLTNINYFECEPILKIVRAKKAWEFEVIVLNKLLDKETDAKIVINLKLNLFIVLFNLKNHQEVIKNGIELLDCCFYANDLTDQQKEILVAYTIMSCLERGKIFNESLLKAKGIMEKYCPSRRSFEYRIGIEAEVYLKNNEPQNAMRAVVDGIKERKILSSGEYAKLYFLVVVQIGNQIGEKLDSLKIIEKNTFVKMKKKDQWYFLGNGNELDALKLSEANARFSAFIGKLVGEEVIVSNDYGEKQKAEIIEYIFSIEKYIYWQVVSNFQKMVENDALEGVTRIKVPEKEGKIDLKYILKYFQDLKSRTDKVFDVYCKNDVPLALLATVECGLVNAIASIQQEERGFVNFCRNDLKEFESQMEIARKIIEGGIPIYLDVTSAIVLSETGLLIKIHKYLPNIKVPQSVINYLIDISERFICIEGNLDFIGYFRGDIHLTTIEKKKADVMRDNIRKSVEILEANPNNVSSISIASKADNVLLQEIPGEICDACVLAQKEKTIILTEDYLFLRAFESEGGIEQLEYFSSFALIRVLYEESKITFKEYLEYYYYLSLRRFRFLFINIKDVERAVLGDGKLKLVNPENIRKFNFRLTLSDEYGVSFKTAFLFVGRILFNLLVDNAVMSNVFERVFIEIIEAFPQKMNKNNLGKMLLKYCKEEFDKNTPKYLMIPRNCIIDEKLKNMELLLKVRDFEMHLWTPSY